MERAVPILPATDLRVAKAFYLGQLGFTLRFDASTPDGLGILGVERGAIVLTLDAPMSGHGRNAAVALEVASADALYAEWRERLADLKPPKEEPWGARTFSAHDPFGNTLFVIGPASPSRTQDHLPHDAV